FFPDPEAGGSRSTSNGGLPRRGRLWAHPETAGRDFRTSPVQTKPSAFARRKVLQTCVLAGLEFQQSPAPQISAGGAGNKKETDRDVLGPSTSLAPGPPAAWPLLACAWRSPLDRPQSPIRRPTMGDPVLTAA